MDVEGSSSYNNDDDALRSAEELQRKSAGGRRLPRQTRLQAPTRAQSPPSGGGAGSPENGGKEASPTAGVATVIPDLQPWQDPFEGSQRRKSSLQQQAAGVTGSSMREQPAVLPSGGVPVLSCLSDEGLDLLQSEVFLSRLVKLYGPAYNIEADAKEVARFQLETCEQHVQLIKRQEVPDLHFLRRLLYGSLGGLMLVLMGLLIFILGMVTWLTARQAKVVRIPYATGDDSVLIDLGGGLGNEIEGGQQGLGDLKRGQQVILAFWVDQFYAVERTVYGSQPEELVGGLSCDPHHQRLEDLLGLRPQSSLGFANLPSNQSTFVFPCGTTPFTFFNDEGYLADGEKDTAARVPLDPDYTRVQPYNYMTFQSPARPHEATPHDDWVQVDSDAFRMWVAPPAGAFRYLPIGRTAKDFQWKSSEPNQNSPSGRNRYNFKLADSSWPAEQFSAIKGLAAIKLSGVTGLCPPVVGLCITVYGICVFVAGLAFLAFHGRFKLLTPTVSVQQLRPRDIRDTIERVAAANAKTRQIIMRALRREGAWQGGQYDDFDNNNRHRRSSRNTAESSTPRLHAQAGQQRRRDSHYLNPECTDPTLTEIYMAAATANSSDNDWVPPSVVLAESSQKAATARAAVRGGDRSARNAVPKRGVSGG